MVETDFDTLNAKSSYFAIKCEFDNLNIELPGDDLGDLTMRQVEH